MDRSTTQSPSSNMDTSILCRLPAEVRNQIWEHVLIDSQPITIAAALVGRRYLKYQYRIALLATCKQIRSECTGLYYHNNTFELVPDVSSCADQFFVGIELRKFLASLDRTARSALSKNILISFEQHYFCDHSLDSARHCGRRCSHLNASLADTLSSLAHTPFHFRGLRCDISITQHTLGGRDTMARPIVLDLGAPRSWLKHVEAKREERSTRRSDSNGKVDLADCNKRAVYHVYHALRLISPLWMDGYPGAAIKTDS